MDESGRKARTARGPGSYRLLLLVGAMVVVLDQLTKAIVVSALALHDSIPLVDGFLNLVHVRNPGAAFSLLADAPASFRTPFFIGITVAAIGALVYIAGRLPKDERLLRVAMGAVLGGAVGNLVDRLAYGEVIDFIDVYLGSYHWPAFN
ncbi:MAG: signal peptidase II, partial [Candidatus Binatia bacterium]